MGNEQPSSNARIASLRALFNERLNSARPMHREWRTSHTEELLRIAETLSKDVATYENGRVILTGEVDRLRARVRELEANANQVSNWLYSKMPCPAGECCDELRAMIAILEQPTADADRRESDSRGPSA